MIKFTENRSDDWSIKSVMTEAKLREQVLRIIIENNLSFAQAENTEFVKLFRHAYSDVHSLTRQAIATCLKKNVQEIKTQLKKQLTKVNSKIHLTVNC